MSQRSNPNRSTTIQVWLIGALFPVLLILTGPVGKYDFAAFWVAGHQALSGDAINIYSTAATQVYADRLGLGKATIFPYPPHALFFYMPFALAPYISGYLIWNVATAALFYWSARPFLPKDFPPLLSIATPAALICLDFGQTGLLFGALWLLAFRGKWGAVALLTFKPHLGFLSVLSIQSRAALIRVVVLVLVLIAASAILFGPVLWLTFVDQAIGQGAMIGSMKRWLFAGVGPAIGYGFWGWIPFAAAGALMLVRNVNVFTVSTASFVISPYSFHYDMTVASLGFGLAIALYWHEMPIRDRIPIAIGFLSPVIAIGGAWWVPPLLLWSLWAQVRYNMPEHSIH